MSWIRGSFHCFLENHTSSVDAADSDLCISLLPRPFLKDTLQSPQQIARTKFRSHIGQDPSRSDTGGADKCFWPMFLSTEECWVTQTRKDDYNPLIVFFFRTYRAFLSSLVAVLLGQAGIIPGQVYAAVTCVFVDTGVVPTFSTRRRCWGCCLLMKLDLRYNPCHCGKMPVMSVTRMRQTQSSLFIRTEKYLKSCSL